MTGEPPGPEAFEHRPSAEAAPPRRPGLTTFTIEGRAAPGLFVLGWLASLLGLGIALIAVMAGGGVPGGVLFVAGLALLSVGLIAAAGSQALERWAASATGYVGPSPVLVFAAVFALTIVLIVAVGTPLVALGMEPDGPLAAMVSLAVTAFAYLVLIRLLVVGTGALTWRDMGFTSVRGSLLADLAWGAVLAVPVLFTTGLLARLLSLVFPLPPDVLPPAPDAQGLVANLVAAALIAPIAEEAFFRGFATTAWKRSVGPRQALLRGTLFFAIAHILTLSGSGAAEAIGFAIFAFIVRLPVSFALGWVFLRRGSLYAPIALHAVFNGLQVLAVASMGSAGGG